MGKRPVFGIVSLCWLSLVLAGCETSNSSITKNNPNQYKSSPTWPMNKDVSPSAPADTTVKDSRPMPNSGQDRPAGFAAGGSNAGSGGPSPVPDTSTQSNRYNPLAGSGQRTPGAAGMLDAPAPPAPPSGVTNNGTPVSSMDNATGTRSTYSSGRAPLPPSPGDGPSPIGPTSSTLPPPPGASNTLLLPPTGPMVKPPPPTAPSAMNDLPPPPPPLVQPVGFQSTDGPPLPQPLPNTKSIDPIAPGTVYEAATAASAPSPPAPFMPKP